LAACAPSGWPCSPTARPPTTRPRRWMFSHSQALWSLSAPFASPCSACGARCCACGTTPWATLPACACPSPSCTPTLTSWRQAQRAAAPPSPCSCPRALCPGSCCTRCAAMPARAACGSPTGACNVALDQARAPAAAHLLHCPTPVLSLPNCSPPPPTHTHGTQTHAMQPLHLPQGALHGVPPRGHHLLHARGGD